MPFFDCFSVESASLPVPDVWREQNLELVQLIDHPCGSTKANKFTLKKNLEEIARAKYAPAHKTMVLITYHLNMQTELSSGYRGLFFAL